MKTNLSKVPSIKTIFIFLLRASNKLKQTHTTESFLYFFFENLVFFFYRYFSLAISGHK